jgi:hypothetical protein
MQISVAKKTNTYISFGEVHLEKAVFEWADLQKSVFAGAKMDGAKFWSANAKDADFHGTCLVGAKLQVAHFENCDFNDAILENASFTPSWLNGAKFTKSDLRGCSIRASVVDGSTRFWNCIVNRYSKDESFTDTTGIPLDNVIIDPATKQLLEYNIRRMNWEEWYKKRRLLKWPVRLFWCFSDYGISTWRIIGWFFGLALIFAAIYTNCACWFPPGIVNNLDVEPHLPIWHYFLLLLLRPIYFSVVTMTTGFSNMYANAQSIWGHILIGLQVLLGYVLLGALVTRFAVLFTAGGPAGRFADENKKDADDKVS